MKNDDLKAEGSVDARASAGSGWHSPATTGQMWSDALAEGHSSSEPSLDLREWGRQVRSGLSGEDAHEGDWAPRTLPGWRFVEDGTGIWFSDGRSRRRTIALPTILEAMPERGLRRALRFQGGMRPVMRARNLDRIRRLTLQLVVMTEYRELLYQAAIADFERPLLVERGVRFVQVRREVAALHNDLSVPDEGMLRVDLDRITFKGLRCTRTAAGRLVRSIQDDMDGGTLSLHPSRDRPWQLDGVSPVGVFAAACACRMSAEDSQHHRSHPAKTAAGLLDPNDPLLPVPGDDVVIELERLCGERAASGRDLNAMPHRR